MKKALLVVALLSSAAYGTYSWISSDDSPAKPADESLMQDRL